MISYWMSFIFILSIFTFDQLTKHVICLFSSSLPFQVTPFFNLVFTKNRGMSFGVFHSTSGPIFYALTIVIIALCVYLAYWLWREKNPKIIIALNLILGGALGNLWDRFFRQGVLDFLDFHLDTYHWPAFNIADSFIFLGVLLLLWDNIKSKKKVT